MKKLLYLIAISAVVALSSSGCKKKYEDGPAFGLQSKTNRISNTWKLETFFNNDVDRTAEYTATHVNYTTTYTKEGVYTYSFIDEAGETDSGAGTWVFSDKKEQIIVSEGVETHVLYILRLTEHDFWYYTIHGNDKHEFHMTSKL